MSSNAVYYNALNEWANYYLNLPKGINQVDTSTMKPREGDTIRVTQTKVTEGKYAEDGCIITGTYGDHDSIPKDAKVEVLKRRNLKVQDLLSGEEVYYNVYSSMLRPGHVIRNQRTGSTLVQRSDYYFQNQAGDTFSVSSFLKASPSTQYKVIYLGEG